MMSAPLLLDLFCGAGGCGVGYTRAGFRVVGCDLNPKPLRHNPHECYQGDALAVLDALLDGGAWHGYRLNDFAAIHASPPCQAYTRARHIQRREHPELLEPTRERLLTTQLPWVMENVSGAPMGHFVELCGTQFDLPIYRHRQFESSELLMSPGKCHHPTKLLPGHYCIYGDVVRGTATGNTGNRYQRYPVAVGRAAMGIDWYMTQAELSQAIPPAYTQWLGAQLLRAISADCALARQWAGGAA